MVENAGVIVIGTKVDDKGATKGIKKLYTEVEILEKEAVAMQKELDSLGKQKIDLQEKFAASGKRIEENTRKAQYFTKEIEKWQKRVDDINKELSKGNYDAEIRRAMEYSKTTALGNIDTAKFNKGMAEDGMKKELELQRKLNAEMEKQDAKIERKEIALDKINGKIDEQQQKMEAITYSGDVYDFSRAKEYGAQLDLLDEKIEQLTKEHAYLVDKFGEESEEAKKVEVEIEKLINQYNRLEEQQRKITAGPLKKLSNGFEGLIKKALRLGLAVLGIRTIMNLITRSFNILSQYNSEISNKMQNMRLVLAVALEPLIIRIVNWLQTIMAYINYLTKAWFGLDLYARASELTTKKIAENMAGAAGSAKDMRKQLAGFDEMNVLGDNVKGAGGGGGGASSIPSFDLDPNVEIPEWLRWIKDNGPVIVTIIGAIAAALLAVKLAPFIAGLVGATTSMSLFTAGLALIAAGVVLLIGNIINLILNWDEMDDKQKTLCIGLAALGAAFIALGIEIAAGMSAATMGISLVIAAIATLIAWIALAVSSNEEEKDSIDLTTKAQREYTKAKEEAEKAVDEYVRKVDNAEKSEKDLRDIMEKAGITNEQLNDIVKRGTKDYKNLNDVEKEVFKAYRNNQTAQKELTESTKKMKKETYEEALAAAKATEDWETYGKTLEEAMMEGIINSEEMSDQLAKDFNSISNESKKALVENLPNNVKNAFDWDKYEGAAEKFKRKWDNVIKALDKEIELQVNVKTGYYAGSGGGMRAKGALAFAKGGIINIPKLATGAVINRPGSGVPVMSGIAGEAGREGVLPLTDYQAMEMLGREIGKWITINATIPVNVGNRQVARVMEELGQQRAFAKND